MSWREIDSDDKHRAFRCVHCRRMCVTPIHMTRPASDCACRSKS